ncbi:MAG TPA: WD40 repeat domain-containing protein [Thermoleophilaceae bacterium]|nr:WD40 repeat domain-containing protein [Thermoleophilaceae bacterium]
MTGERLQRLLERAGDVGRADAEVRARLVVQQAFGERAPEARPAVSRGPLAVAVAVVAAALIAVVAATSPGAAIAQWLRDHVIGKPGLRHSAPALTHLPGGGRLLLRSQEGVWVVTADGTRRLLAGYAGATWSPRGLYIGAWRGRELFAVEPGGRVHWSLARPGRIRAADWSPDGYRIAYLTGDQLRVVAGDGTGDGVLRTRVALIAPAWRPQSPHLLAFAARPRMVDLVATDARALVWRHRVRERVAALSWSADGTLLAVAGRAGVTILNGRSGAVRRVIRMPHAERVRSIAFSQRGHKLAVVTRSARGRARAFVVPVTAAHPRPRELFEGAGSFEQPQWSPDDRWVLLGWPTADQWLFLRAARVSSIRAVGAIARQFSSDPRRATFPRVGGWCCGPGGGG